MHAKKLIETSIPLDEINAQAVREKSVHNGHPSGMHLWWARRPLAVARCVIFASMVDDPGEHPELFPTQEEQDKERERLFDIIKRLADWDNIGDERLYEEAHAEMVKHAPDGKLPEFLDPFAGGGALPLEAQRLGLVSHAADLNPIPVTINRAMIDIPARFCGQDPVNPEARRSGLKGTYPRATGLAADVEYYANVMRERAKERIGQNYPDVDVTKGSVTKKATPIAYIWARTVTCPNPACRHETPLVRSFWLSKKKNHRAYIDPIAEGGKMCYEVHCEGDGKPADFAHVHDGTVGRRGSVCLHCGAPISLDYVRAESRDHGLGSQLMAIISESPFVRGRWYSSATQMDNQIALLPLPADAPSQLLPKQALGFRIQAYGFRYWRDLYTNRQLIALLSLSDIIQEIKADIQGDALQAGMTDDSLGLSSNGYGACAYAEAISVYLSFAIDKLSDYNSTICTWNAPAETMRNVFARQAIPMTWDYAEANPLSSSTGSLKSMVSQITDALKKLPAHPKCDSIQRDAAQTTGLSNLLVSTDPPYYDNIDYSDLSDYFYIWMRRSLKNVWPDTFGTMLTPKAEELIATPYRFDGGAQAAKAFFENGMKETFTRLAKAMSDEYPMTVYYAYKQSEDTEEGTTSSGWETMLQALMDSGLQITGTWPMRTERTGRTRDVGSNALASSIVLVCRRRPEDAPIASRPEFLRALRRGLRDGLADLQQGSIAPVDLAQAAIGPGMAAFSKYAQVIEADGRPMSVHTALGIINEQLDALMGESGEDLDGETRFCLSWYAQYGFDKGPFGDAETLRNARGASLAALTDAGVLESGGGKVRLVRPGEEEAPFQMRVMQSTWSAFALELSALEGDGIEAAASVAAEIGPKASAHVKSLAYILYQTADKHGRTDDAALFNGLVTSWEDVSERAEEIARSKPVQQKLDLG